jgi:hypothetical protein
MDVIPGLNPFRMRKTLEKHAQTGGAEGTIKTGIFRARKMLDFRRSRRLPGRM